MIRRLILTGVMIGLLIGLPPTVALTRPHDQAVVYIHVIEILSSTALGGDLIDVTLYLPQAGGRLLAYGPTDPNGYVMLAGDVYPDDVVGVFLSRGGLGGRFYLTIPMRFCGFQEIREIQTWNLWLTIVHPSALIRARWSPIHDDL